MKSAVIAFALAAGAVATPVAQLEEYVHRKAGCINQRQAEKFMDRFTKVLEHVDSDLGTFDATAQAILTDDFMEISDSINILAGKPLGGVTADKSAYIAGAKNAPGVGGIESTVNIFACDSILWQWNMNAVGKATYPVKGMAAFKMVKTGDRKVKFQASELKLEFNSIAWGLDTGYGWIKQDGTWTGRAPVAPAASNTGATTGTTTGATTTGEGADTDAAAGGEGADDGEAAEE